MWSVHVSEAAIPGQDSLRWRVNVFYIRIELYETRQSRASANSRRPCSLLSIAPRGQARSRSHRGKSGKGSTGIERALHLQDGNCSAAAFVSAGCSRLCRSDRQLANFAFDVRLLAHRVRRGAAAREDRRRMVSHADRGRGDMEDVRGGADDDDADAKMARWVFCRHSTGGIGLAHQYDRECRPRLARRDLERRARVVFSIIDDGSRGTSRTAQ